MHLLLVIVMWLIAWSTLQVGLDIGKIEMWSEIARQRCAEQGMEAVIDADQWRYTCVEAPDAR